MSIQMIPTDFHGGPLFYTQEASNSTAFIWFYLDSEMFLIF